MDRDGRPEPVGPQIHPQLAAFATLEGHGILVSADELSVSIEAKSVSDRYHPASTFAAMIETPADSVDLPNDVNSTPARHSASEPRHFQFHFSADPYK